jgi:hypothetical protein
LTAAQYRACLKTLALSNARAGEVLGFDRRQSQRYAKGDRPVPGSVAIALALTVHNKLFIEQALAIADGVDGELG